MKIRLISGSVYIALLAGFFCLKIFLPYGDFYFDALIYAFALLGTFEILRATKEKTTKAQRGLVYAFSAIMLPACAVGEYFKGSRVAAVLSAVTDLLAGIPSIIYGLWGFYTLRPLIMALNISPQGSGILTASLVLAIMIVPYAASLSSEFIKMVPNDLKEGAYSLGATRAEVIRKVIFPVAGSGVFSAYILAIGRALGETMTVTMLIGNTNSIPDSITSTGNSMASIIANQFGEASDLRFSSLIAIGLVLFLITAIINMVGKLMIKRARIS